MPSAVSHHLLICLIPLTQSVCLLAGLDMRTSEVAFVGPVFLCPSEPTGRPRRPLLFWGRVLGFRILRDLRGWASKDRVATP